VKRPKRGPPSNGLASDRDAVPDEVVGSAFLSAGRRYLRSADDKAAGDTDGRCVKVDNHRAALASQHRADGGKGRSKLHAAASLSMIASSKRRVAAALFGGRVAGRHASRW
jgi:hypothetical protein